MEAIRIHRVIEKDGEIILNGLPYKKGQHIEMIFLQHSGNKTRNSRLTARKLLHSDLIGLWKDRNEIEVSPEYARKLREKAQNRQG